MIRTIAVAKRIITQFAHDKRTLALMFVAPIFALWLLSILLGSNAYVPTIAVVDMPEEYVLELKQQDAEILEIDAKKAQSLIENDELDAILTIKEGTTTLDIYLEGGNNSHNAAVSRVVAEATAEYSAKCREEMQEDLEAKKKEAEALQAEAKQKQADLKAEVEGYISAAKSSQAKAKQTQEAAIKKLQGVIIELPPASQAVVGTAFKEFSDSMSSLGENNLLKNMGTLNFDGINMDEYSLDMDLNVDEYMPIQNTETSYLHGNDDWEMFDFYGPVFIGIFIFVFTFLTSGMSLVNERSAGTVERFLATPINPIQILGGYALGFGVFSLIQVAVILTAALKFLEFPNNGNAILVALVAMSMAIASVTLGLLVSGLAKSAFQVIQLMIVFVVPQILLSGVFDLSGAPSWLQTLADCLPVKYGVEALQDIMLRGSDFSNISADFTVVWAFIAGFFLLAALGFKKKRAR